MRTCLVVAVLLAPPPMAHAADSLAVQAAAPADAKPSPADGQDSAGSGKKSKKKAKAPKDGADAVPAPDEPTDDGQIIPESTPVAPPRSGLEFAWKKHPSLRAGKAFRIDFKGQFQEDAHGSYPLAPGLNCPGTALPIPCTWELHRNRIGVEGELFKHIEFEVERELTEQELTDKDVLLGYTPESQWKDVNVNLTYVKNAQVQIG